MEEVEETKKEREEGGGREVGGGRKERRERVTEKKRKDKMLICDSGQLSSRYPSRSKILGCCSRQLFFNLLALTKDSP